MNGRTARELRRQAGGNKGLYILDEVVGKPFPDITGKLIQCITYVSVLDVGCSRYRYKQLKKQIKH